MKTYEVRLIFQFDGLLFKGPPFTQWAGSANELREDYLAARKLGARPNSCGFLAREVSPIASAEAHLPSAAAQTTDAGICVTKSHHEIPPPLAIKVKPGDKVFWGGKEFNIK